MPIPRPCMGLVPFFLMACQLICPLLARADVQTQVVGPGSIPHLKVDSTGRLHLLYQDQHMVRYRSYTTAWSASEDVPGSQGVSSKKTTRHRFAVWPDGTRVYVTWGYGNGTDIDFAMKDSSGWHGPELACPGSVRAWEYAAVAATSSNDVFVFCQFDDAWVAHRSLSSAWEGPTLVYDIPPGAKHIAADTDMNDEIHVFCRKGPVTYFHGDGVSFSPLIFLETAGSTELPAFVFDGSNQIHLVWQDWVHLSDWVPQTLRYARGHDHQWSNGNEGVLVHTYVELSNPPEVAVDGAGNVAITWIEGTEVLISLSRDGGDTFEPAQVLAADPRPIGILASLPGDLRTAPVVFVGNQLHAVYENGSGDLVHLYGLEPFVSTPDAGVEADAQIGRDAAAQPDSTAQLPDGGPVKADADSSHHANLQGGCGCASTRSGRMSPAGAFALLLLGVLLCYGRKRRRKNVHML